MAMKRRGFFKSVISVVAMFGLSKKDTQATVKVAKQAIPFRMVPLQGTKLVCKFTQHPEEFKLDEYKLNGDCKVQNGYFINASLPPKHEDMIL